MNLRVIIRLSKDLCFTEINLTHSGLVDMYIPGQGSEIDPISTDVPVVKPNIRLT